jgi:alkylation response protein AidB-like acyl-CoA dehydrogenase
MSIRRSRACSWGIQADGPEILWEPHTLTRLGAHALDYNCIPKRRKSVHAFIRATPSITIKETWDVMGMRATRSDDTILEGVFRPRQVRRPRPAHGFAGADLFVLVFSVGRCSFCFANVGTT